MLFCEPDQEFNRERISIPILGNMICGSSFHVGLKFGYYDIKMYCLKNRVIVVLLVYVYFSLIS